MSNKTLLYILSQNYSFLLISNSNNAVEYLWNTNLMNLINVARQDIISGDIIVLLDSLKIENIDMYITYSYIYYYICIVKTIPLILWNNTTSLLIFIDLRI